MRILSERSEHSLGKTNQRTSEWCLFPILFKEGSMSKLIRYSFYPFLMDTLGLRLRIHTMACPTMGTCDWLLIFLTNYGLLVIQTIELNTFRIG